MANADENGWMPMSDAPRDGTRILMWRKQRTEQGLLRPIMIGRYAFVPGTRKCWVLDGTSWAKDDDFIGWQHLPGTAAMVWRQVPVGASYAVHS